MLVNRQIPALYNGVSQQPATTRLSSQCESQINFYSTVVDGLRRRPPSEHLANLGSVSGAFIHSINRDVNERYKVILTDGNLRVFDLNGNEKTVTFPDGKAYLNVSNAEQDFACVTVADYTFIVNKRVVVEMDELAADTNPPPSYYYWLNRYYSGMDPYGYAVQRQYGPNPSGGTFRGTVQAFAELPETPMNGDIYKVQGTTETAFASYYVRRNGGVWDETVMPGLRNSIKASTLPHALVRKADGTFEFAPFSFAPRRVGDEATNRNPTFVGRAIRDVFFYKNRLGFLVDENAVLSRAGDFGNFFRMTVLDVLDDDTIDVGASETKVTRLNHAVTFDGGMMAFSDQTQFRLSHGDVLTPTGCSLEAVTHYEMVERVKPITLGSDIFFAVEDGDWARLYEYYVRSDSNSSEADDVSGHVPRYIPAGVRQLAGSSQHDVVFALTDGAPNRIYVYKFYWANETDKAQSAWSYWEFPPSTRILSIDLLGNDLYLVIDRPGYGASIERIQLDSGATISALGFQLFLDRRAQVTGYFLNPDNATEFVLPYHVPPADRARFRIVKGAGYAGAKGALVAVDPSAYTWLDSNTVRVAQNIGGVCYAGFVYPSRYQFSEVYMRNAQDVPITGGLLTLNSYVISFKDTAYFRTEIAPYGVGPDIETIIPSRLSEFDGKTLGDINLTLGTPVYSADSFRMDIFGDSRVATVTIVNDSPYASTFVQAEWEGNWVQRSRTV